MKREQVTVLTLQEKKQEGQKISMVTAYDYPFADLVDRAGIDCVLVGDSLGIVVQGHETTIPVTMDQMIYHTAIVRRAVRRALVIGDMPFLSYRTPEIAVANAGRFLQEGGAAAVKIEALGDQAAVVEALVRAGIPVMAHLGLTPQAVHRMGGYKVQGREEQAAQRLLEEAQTAEQAGAFAVLLEGIPAKLAKAVTERIGVPTIGIGAGPHCDGQVLVLHDLLGLFDRFTPKFVKRYAHLGAEALDALRRFKEEVESGVFPGEEQSFH
ncbi:MAG: 3-methyl-2-oxobutanoate hydroxymethyltransferase [Nitrospirae bacterium]|nr:3-methyl-2-oxobutanoate hydroxymethyltransferase [Nitrospirota bacterium]